MKCLTTSIKHWERLLTAATAKDLRAFFSEGLGVNYCACCQEFIEAKCYGCPIYEHTGEPLCIGTPYPRVEKLFFAFSWSENTWPEIKEAVSDELNFLRSIE